MVVLRELICKSFQLQVGVLIWKELIFNSFYLGKSVVILKELDFNIFNALEGCGGLEGTHF